MKKPRTAREELKRLMELERLELEIQKRMIFLQNFQREKEIERAWLYS